VPRRVVQLWSMPDEVMLLIEHPSGVVYQNQVGGNVCEQAEIEGVLVPLGMGRESFDGIMKAAYPTGSQGIPSATADEISWRKLRFGRPRRLARVRCGAGRAHVAKQRLSCEQLVNDSVDDGYDPSDLEQRPFSRGSTRRRARMARGSHLPRVADTVYPAIEWAATFNAGGPRGQGSRGRGRRCRR
jgi:hypothetical protein